MDAEELLKIARHCVKAFLAGRARPQRADREDLQQDVLVHLLMALKSYDPAGVPLRAYLFVVGHRAVRMYYARLAKRARHERQIVPDLDDRAVCDRPREDGADEVAFLMQCLSPAKRAAVEACALGGENPREYSARRGRSKASDRELVRLAKIDMWHFAVRRKEAG